MSRTSSLVFVAIVVVATAASLALTWDARTKAEEKCRAQDFQTVVGGLLYGSEYWDQEPWLDALLP